MLQATVMDPQQATFYFSQIDWLQPSWDVFVIAFFLVASLVYGFALGRDRIIVMLVSIYMSLAVVRSVPYIQEFNASISFNETFALKISVFLGLFILLFFFLSQSALIRTLGSSSEQGRFFQVIIFSFVQTGLLISTSLSFFPEDVSGFISPLTQVLFTGEIATTIWIILPIVTMAIIGAKSKVD